MKFTTKARPLTEERRAEREAEKPKSWCHTCEYKTGEEFAVFTATGGLQKYYKLQCTECKQSFGRVYPVEHYTLCYCSYCKMKSPHPKSRTDGYCERCGTKPVSPEVREFSDGTAIGRRTSHVAPHTGSAGVMSFSGESWEP